MVGTAVVSLSVDLFGALKFNALLPNAVSKGWAAEPASWLYHGLLQPILIGYFYWLQRAGGQVFADLAGKKAFEPREHLTDQFARCRRRFQNRWASYATAMASLLFTGWFVLAFTQTLFRSPYPSWLTVSPVLVIIRVPFVFIAFYSLVVVIYDLVVIIIALNDLFTNLRIHIEAMNPDRAGGIGAIGRFSANLGYGIGIMGLALSLSIIQAPSISVVLNDYSILTAITLYLLFAPLIFLSPLWTAHLAMMKCRDRLLSENSTNFDIAFNQLQRLLSNDDKEVEPALKRVQRLMEIKTIVSQFPVWPFNFQAVSKFVSLVTAPLLPRGISIIMNLIPNLAKLK